MKRNRSNTRDRHYSRVVMPRQAEAHKKWGAWLGLAFIVLLAIFFAVAARACGTERWTVKVLKDSGAKEINFAPETRVLHELIEIHAPANLRSDGEAKRFPSEKQVYRVDALLLGYKREADGDYHLVLADPVDRKKTMIAEIPEIDCAPQKYAKQFTAAGAFIEALGHATPKFKTLAKPVRVTVTGVFFFDYIHGQTGVAPNGAELHPVLAIERGK